MSFFTQASTGPACSKQAFSKQRRKLKAEFFHDWNNQLPASFYTHSKCQNWKSFRLLAIDGSSVILPDRQDTRSKYGISVGTTTGVGSPVARICVLYDLLNQLALKGLLHSYNSSEETVVLDVLRDENMEHCLLLFDRGYLSYWLIYELLQRNACFVMRAACNANNLIKQFLSSTQTDITLDIFPPYSSLKKLRDAGRDISKRTPVKIRLVKVVLETGETEVLVTNLYDKVLYTIEDLKDVYHLRWGIETYYGYMKEELQLGVFSGITPICTEQDFAVNLFLFNLQSIIEKQCEPYTKKVGKNRKYRYKINKNVAWASLKYRVVKLFIEEDPREILMMLECLFCRYLEPIRPGRKYPRIHKRKHKDKHYTLTNYKRAVFSLS